MRYNHIIATRTPIICRTEDDIIMSMKPKHKAVELRKEGYSYSYISEKTGLSKSTLSYHLSKLNYQPNKYTISHIKKMHIKSIATRQTQKQQRLTKAMKVARHEFGILCSRDVFIAGIALYAGEGSKTQNLVRLVNADIKVIVFFIRWLTVLGVPRKNIMIRVHGYPDMDIKKAESFWLKGTKLPQTQLQSACIDTRAKKDRKRNGTHPYGTAHVTVRANGRPEFGTVLFRKIAAYQEILFS